MGLIRRLDHIAVAVRDTDSALDYFRDRLRLEVVVSEELTSTRVRLTYLAAGNAYIQLVEPLDPAHEVAHWISEHGEGVHHVCFAVEDVFAAATQLGLPGSPPVSLSSGRGRVSALVPGPVAHGFRVECTEFRYGEDVEATKGWISPSPSRKGNYM